MMEANHWNPGEVWPVPHVVDLGLLNGLHHHNQQQHHHHPHGGPGENESLPYPPTQNSSVMGYSTLLSHQFRRFTLQGLSSPEDNPLPLGGGRSSHILDTPNSVAVGIEIGSTENPPTEEETEESCCEDEEEDPLHVGVVGQIDESLNQDVSDGSGAGRPVPAVVVDPLSKAQNSSAALWTTEYEQAPNPEQDQSIPNATGTTTNHHHLGQEQEEDPDSGFSVHGKMYYEGRVVLHLKQSGESGGTQGPLSHHPQPPQTIHGCTLCRNKNDATVGGNLSHNSRQIKEAHRHLVRGVFFTFEDCIIVELYPDSVSQQNNNNNRNPKSEAMNEFGSNGMSLQPQQQSLYQAHPAHFLSHHPQQHQEHLDQTQQANYHSNIETTTSLSEQQQQSSASNDHHEHPTMDEIHVAQQVEPISSSSLTVEQPHVKKTSGMGWGWEFEDSGDTGEGDEEDKKKITQTAHLDHLSPPTQIQHPQTNIDCSEEEIDEDDDSDDDDQLIIEDGGVALSIEQSDPTTTNFDEFHHHHQFQQNEIPVSPLRGGESELGSCSPEAEHEFYCTNCSLQFSTKESLIEHGLCRREESQKHPSPKPMTTNSINKKRKRKKGQAYKESPSSSQSLVSTNIQSICSNRPFSCDVCSKSFTVLRRLENHKLSHSIIKSPQQCEKCGKSFSRKDKLLRHMYVHAEQKLFSCSLCPKRFSRRDKLSDHLKSHGGPEDEIHCCPMCTKEFLRPDILKQHIKLHNMVNKYQCPECLRFVTGEERLQQHILRHQEAKAQGQPLLCPLCTKNFIQRQSLKAHIKKFHVNASTTLLTALDFHENSLEASRTTNISTEKKRIGESCKAKTLITTDDKETGYECTECQDELDVRFRLFPKKSLLLQHQAKVHGGRKNGKKNKANKYKVTKLKEKSNDSSISSSSSGSIHGSISPPNTDWTQQQAAAPTDHDQPNILNANRTLNSIFLPSHNDQNAHAGSNHGYSLGAVSLGIGAYTTSSTNNPATNSTPVTTTNPPYVIYSNYTYQ